MAAIALAITGLRVQNGVFADAIARDTQSLFELGSIAPFDFKKIQPFPEAKIVNMPDLSVDLIERLLRFRDVAAARSGESPDLRLAANSAFACSSRLTRRGCAVPSNAMARESSDVAIMAAMKNDAILMPSGRS